MAFATEHELFSHLYDKLISRELTTFAELAAYAEGLKAGFKLEPVINRAFLLLKEMHWGFFRAMSKATHVKLWKELVVRHETYREGGDLKRSISISNLYIAILDIHGYTRFCQESKGNLSKLHRLDEFITDGIGKISMENGCISQRERGDEILVVAASASDCLASVLSIIDSFSRKPVLRGTLMTRGREDYGVNLPDFKISAGIAGGNISIPLILTDDGQLSGFLLNTAARLQARANELSPTQSRIVTSKTLHTSLVAEQKQSPSEFFKRVPVFFFDSGPIDFKGTSVLTCEVLFREEDRYRERIVGYLGALIESVKADLWQQRVFLDLIELILRSLQSMGSFTLQAQTATGPEPVTNIALAELCEKARRAYEHDEDFALAVDTLERLVRRIEIVPAFDRLVLDYARGITEKYRSLVEPYEAALDGAVEKNIDQIFNAQYKQAYQQGQKMLDTYRKLQRTARRHPALVMKKQLWYQQIEKNMEKLRLRVWSGKK